MIIDNLTSYHQRLQYLPPGHPALLENNESARSFIESALSPAAAVTESARGAAAGASPCSNTGIKSPAAQVRGDPGEVSSVFSRAARSWFERAAAAAGRPVIDWESDRLYGERVEIRPCGRGKSEVIIHPLPVGREDRAAIIDTLTVVLPDSAFLQLAWGVSDDDVIRAVDREIIDRIGLSVDLSRVGPGRNFYDFSARLVPPPGVDVKVTGSLGFAAWGGNGGGVCLHLTGLACNLILPETWARLSAWFGTIGARITNVHLAHDDYTGERGVDYAVTVHETGGFTSGGRPPSSSVAGDWFGGQRGRTLYIGNRKSGKMLRVYEKGKQLGDPSSAWVRWEVELRSHQRVIPVEVLASPGRYLAGAYPPCSFIERVQSVIKTIERASTIALDVLVQHARRAYGPLLSYLRAMTDADEVIRILARPGVPRRLSDPGAVLQALHSA